MVSLIADYPDTILLKREAEHCLFLSSSILEYSDTILVQSLQTYSDIKRAEIYSNCMTFW